MTSPGNHRSLRLARLFSVMVFSLLPTSGSLAGPGFLVTQAEAGVGPLFNDARGAKASETPKKVVHGNPGPWGSIEYYQTFLEAPEPLVEMMTVPSWQPVWRFPGHDRAQVIKLIEECKLGAAFGKHLLIESTWDDESGDEVRLFPPIKLVSELSVEARQRVYRILRRWEENPYHWSPLIVESGTVREWFADAGLPEKIVSEIERLAYPLGDAIAFSDLPLLIGWSKGDGEDRRIMKAMTRTATLMVRLRLEAEADPEELSDYWTMGQLRTDAISIIENRIQSGTEDVVDLAHFLPPTPRKLLYTFPSSAMGLSGSFPDSLWTATNFLTFQPIISVVDEHSFGRTMERLYVPVEGDLRFGDVVALRRKGGENATLACVFIADDIVYTKSSRAMSCPWVLSKLTHLKAVVREESTEDVEIRAWRRKYLPSTN